MYTKTKLTVIKEIDKTSQAEQGHTRVPSKSLLGKNYEILKFCRLVGYPPAILFPKKNWTKTFLVGRQLKFSFFSKYGDDEDGLAVV